MGLDTIKLRSPHLSEDVARAIEAALVLRSAVDCATGELLWSFTSGALLGSWDSRISVDIKREEWVSRFVPGSRSRHTTLVVSEPYLEIEGSVHKAMLGHNVRGAPTDFAASCAWFVDYVARGLGVELPSASAWAVRRVDWAEVYELPYEAIEQYVHGLNMAAFPRRKVARYGDQSLSCPGGTSTVKVYHKGPEFAKHDRGRLSARLDKGVVEQLQQVANNTLRVEVTIKARKLDDDHGGRVPLVENITRDYLLGVYDREVARLLREGGSTMRTVRKHREVRDRLHAMYGPALAGQLFGTWLQFSALGEAVAREKMARRTFYRQRKQLMDAGCAWHGADVRVVEVATILPADFSPVRSDRRRVDFVDPVVLEQVERFRVAA